VYKKITSSGSICSLSQTNPVTDMLGYFYWQWLLYEVPSAYKIHMTTKVQSSYSNSVIFEIQVGI